MKDVQSKNIQVQKITRKNGSTEHFIQTSLSKQNSRCTSPAAVNMTQRSDQYVHENSDVRDQHEDDNQIYRVQSGRTSPAQRALMDTRQQTQYGQMAKKVSSRNLEPAQNNVRVNEFQIKTPTSAKGNLKTQPFNNTTNQMSRNQYLNHANTEKQQNFAEFSAHFVGTKANQSRMAQKNLQGQGTQGQSSNSHIRGVRNVQKLNVANAQIKTRINNNESKRMMINQSNLNTISSPLKQKETYSQYMERLSPLRFTGSPRSKDSTIKYDHRATLSPKQGSGQGSKHHQQSNDSSPQLNSAYLRPPANNQKEQSMGKLSSQSESEKLKDMISGAVADINQRVSSSKYVSKQPSSRNALAAREHEAEDQAQLAQAYESQLRMYESRQNGEQLHVTPGRSEGSQNTYLGATAKQFGKTARYRTETTTNPGVTEATEEGSDARYSHPDLGLGPAKQPSKVAPAIPGKKQHKFLPFSESIEVLKGDDQSHLLAEDPNTREQRIQHSHIFKKTQNSSQNFRYADIHGASEMKDRDADFKEAYSGGVSKMQESPSADKTVVLEQNFFEHTSPSPELKSPSPGKMCDETKEFPAEASHKVSEFAVDVNNAAQTPGRGSNQPQFCSQKKGKNVSNQLKQTIISSSSHARESFSQHPAKAAPKSVIKSKAAGQRGKRLREIQQSKELRDGAISKAFELIQAAEKIEQNETMSGKSREMSQASLSSNDSLIQTQRKLRKDYEEQKKSMNTGSFLAARQKQNDKTKKPDSGMCLYDDEESVLNHEDILLLHQGNKQRTAEDNPFDLVTPQKGQQNKKNEQNHTPPKRKSRIQKLRQHEQDSSNKKLAKKKSQLVDAENEVKDSEDFPMQKFLSTTSQQEEDAIIERYSQVMKSKKKESNESFVSNKYSQQNKEGISVYLNMDSQEKNGKSNYKDYFNQRRRNGTQKKVSKQVGAEELDDETQFIQSQRQMVMKKPSVPIAVTQSLENYKAFIEENRSPDSFVRISKPGSPLANNNESPQKHIDRYGQEFATRQSLASLSQGSPAKNRSSHKSLGSGSYESTVQIGEKQTSLNSAEKPQRRSRDHLNRVSMDSNGYASQRQSRTSLFKRQSLDGFVETPSAAKESEHMKKKQDTPTKKKQNQNIEINIEKIIQIEDQLNKIQKSFTAMVESRISDEDNISHVIGCCEEWWNIIREPTVSLQLIKCQKILSNLKIQINLKKAFVYQLILFTISGYLISCNQFKFNEQLSQISKLSHWNFLVLCHILVEKFPPQAIERNVWANKLVKLLQNYSNFSEAIQKQFNGQQNDAKPSSSAQGSTQFNIPRELKLQFLQKSNFKIQESFDSIIQASISQRQSLLSDQLTSIYQHQIFDETKYIISNLDKSNENLAEYIERLGRALRPDFDADEDEEDHDGNYSGDATQMTVDDTQMIAPRGQGAQVRSARDEEQVLLQQQFSAQLRVQVDQGFQLIPAPYLPPKEPGAKEYTLVLDLDETLLHFEEINENEGQLSIRPGADSFLKLMQKHFELVIFTAGTQEYADWALNFLENVDCITHRLYRQHALPFNGYYVKDLSRIGRDLSKTLIVDNIAENFQLQPYNGIFIKTWIQDPKDTCLFELAPFVIKMATSKCEDVRDILKVFQDSNDPILYSIAYGCMPPISPGPESPEEKNPLFSDTKPNNKAPIDEMTDSEESFAQNKTDLDADDIDEKNGSSQDKKQSKLNEIDQNAPQGYLKYQQSLTESEKKNQKQKIEEIVTRSKEFENFKGQDSQYHSPEPNPRYGRRVGGHSNGQNNLEDDMNNGLSESRENLSDPRASKYNNDNDNGRVQLRQPRYHNSQEPSAYEQQYIDNHSSSGGSGHTPTPYTPISPYGMSQQDQGNFNSYNKNGHTIYTIPESANEFGSSIDGGSPCRRYEPQFNFPNSLQSQSKLRQGHGPGSEGSNQNSSGSRHR